MTQAQIVGLAAGLALVIAGIGAGGVELARRWREVRRDLYGGPLSWETRERYRRDFER